MALRLWVSLLMLVGTALGTLQADPSIGLAPLPWTIPGQAAPNQQAWPMRPLGPVPPVQWTPPPLLYVHLEGPLGSQITFYRDGGQGQKLDLPCVVGFRPGFIFRCELSGLRDRPGVSYFPTIEVRGSVLLPHRQRNADYPATVVFHEEELEKIAHGTLLHKIVVLERPEKALPYQSSVKAPLEVSVNLSQEPLAEAREHGLPLALVYLGQRQYGPEEMQAIPGTLFLPGDKTLGMPARAPSVPWSCYPLADPKLGTVHPSEYVSVYDGGDSGLPAGFDPQGKLRGVDPSDTVAEYVDSKGRRKIAISNRVALCIPRYIILKAETTPNLWATTNSPNLTISLKTPSIIESDYALVLRVQKLQLEIAKQQAKPSGTSSVYGTSVTGGIKGTQVKASFQTPSTVDGLKLLEKSEDDVPLLICKWPDRTGALIGEIVTFYLKFTNRGPLPIQNVVVVDNLTPRFAYVPGTSKTDRDGTFTFQPNEAGSHLLRWEFQGALPPGESGLISFQVKVR